MKARPELLWRHSYPRAALRISTSSLLAPRTCSTSSRAQSPGSQLRSAKGQHSGNPQDPLECCLYLVQGPGPGIQCGLPHGSLDSIPREHTCGFWFLLGSSFPWPLSGQGPRSDLAAKDNFLWLLVALSPLSPVLHSCGLARDHLENHLAPPGPASPACLTSAQPGTPTRLTGPRTEEGLL